ncbi:MAG: hypothetical protein DRJ01_19290 [Bacteroidetes bacterium]|nr:MAG: hypothetical protein DRJ01_19290 [Bacteroidota bacterium]
MITHYELYNTFFSDDLDIESAKEFFRKIFHEPSVYYPIYFYLIQSKFNENEIKELLANEQGTKNDKIIERFEEGNLNTETEAAKKILKAYDEFKNKKNIILTELSERELRYILQAITHLKETEIEFKYILQVLKEIYDNYFSKKSITKTFIRKAICHIDLVIYGKQYFENKISTK